MPKQNDNELKGVSRRDFIKTTGVGALSVVLGVNVFDTGKAEANQAVATSTSAGEGLPPKPYNVMIILTDQEQYIPDLLGKGHWPGRDRMAKMGTTFEFVGVRNHPLTLYPFSSTFIGRF